MLNITIRKGEVFKLIFNNIPVGMYESFHKMFSGSNQITFNTCRECGGACERNKIGTLLPGEKEYMAGKLGLSVLEFETRYLDTLRMDDGTLIHVLKLGKLCPFLNEENESCECRHFKPVLCKIYPIIFTIETEKISFIIDKWCKLSRKKACKSYFETAIPLLLSFPVPYEWFRHVMSYDNLYFDYEELERYRKTKGKCAAFSLEEILNLQKIEFETVGVDLNFRNRIKESIF